MTKEANPQKQNVKAKKVKCEKEVGKSRYHIYHIYVKGEV